VHVAPEFLDVANRYDVIGDSDRIFIAQRA
jgi:hypothetical protein